jgi:omega-6 fatty acid desaturase (delta-12 desaturase)
MRTSKELLIATKAFACEDRRRSWWSLWSTLGVIGLLLVIVCSDVPWLGRLPFSILLGFVLVRLFVLYHDHQHGAILRGSRFADALMAAIGTVLLNPPSAWRRSHDHHHAHNSKTFGANIGSFSLLTVEGYRNATRRQQLLYAAERHPLTIALGYFAVFFLGMCVAPCVANPRRHFDAGLSAACHAGILLWFAFDETDDLWLAMLVPFGVASALGAFLFYAQHNFPGARIHAGQDWDYTSAALDSSSYIRMGPALSWLTANIGYHHVHHLNARIPFYRLPEAMAGIAELQSPVTITLHPRDVAGCLRLKLWDPDREQLVPWSALCAATTAPHREAA